MAYHGDDRLSRRERRELRRDAQHERWKERRERKRADELANASKVGGLVGIAIALVLVGFVLLHPAMWWLLFVALGIGSGGARQFALASRRDAQEQRARPPAPVEAPAARHEIDELCDQLLVDLKSSAEVVRTFLQDPERTVESLRTTAKTVDERRRALILADAPAKLTALATRRAELSQKRDASLDALARAKFDAALRSLDGEEAALKQLQTMEQRLEGEYSSLVALLQELRTRVAVARSTGAAPQLTDVQQSVQRLNAELEAISESLQLAPIDAEPMTAEPFSTPGRERER